MSKLYVSMYHYTRDLIHSRYPLIKGLDVSLFREQIEFMNSKFNIVTMEQVLEAIDNKTDLPPKALLLTFDDGYIDNYTYAFPILEEYKIQGSFFITGKTFRTHQLLDVNKIHYILANAYIDDLVKDVKERIDYYRGREYDYQSTDELWEIYAKNSRYDSKETVFVKKILQTVLPEELRNIISSELFHKYVGVSEEQLAYELYLTEEQIRLMRKQGMFIGIHGFDHYWLGNLSKDKMMKDIDLALDTLDEFIDRKRWVMNYPYGSYNQDVLDYVEENGAHAGFVAEVGVADLSNVNALEIPRLNCNDFPPKGDNYMKY